MLLWSFHFKSQNVGWIRKKEKKKEPYIKKNVNNISTKIKINQDKQKVKSNRIKKKLNTIVSIKILSTKCNNPIGQKIKY